MLSPVNSFEGCPYILSEWNISTPWITLSAACLGHLSLQPCTTTRSKSVQDLGCSSADPRTMVHLAGLFELQFSGPSSEDLHSPCAVEV